ncbi:MAG TPA: mechanosensitive ion channel domain-containing protein [Methanocella sp.]|nr:mechanosensitive ion channel domain-containing protein [Methanocella sp.]
MILQLTKQGDTEAEVALSMASFFYDNWYKILLSLAILLAALAIIYSLKLASGRVGREYALPSKTTWMINTLITYGMLTLAAISILAVFNVQLYSLIVSLGFFSAVLVLGTQIIISNLLGGIVISIEKSFIVGDVIKVGDNIGVVEGINIRSTIMRGLNGLVITVPNSTFLTTPITNYTRSRQYLIKVPFSTPRAVNPSGLSEAVLSGASSIPGLVSDRGGTLFKTGVSRDDVQYELQFWVTDPRISDDARSRVVDIIDGFYSQFYH